MEIRCSWPDSKCRLYSPKTAVHNAGNGKLNISLKRHNRETIRLATIRNEYVGLYGRREEKKTNKREKKLVESSFELLIYAMCS